MNCVVRIENSSKPKRKACGMFTKNEPYLVKREVNVYNYWTSKKVTENT